MTIETKYNIGDEVWFTCLDELQSSQVKLIEIDINPDGLELSYYLNGTGSVFKEHELTPSKAEYYKGLAKHHQTLVEQYLEEAVKAQGDEFNK